MIYEHTDYREYLHTFYHAQKAKNPWYSFRVFAVRAQIASPNYLKLVIDGKRRITDKTVEAFIRGLGLDAYQAHYFRVLVKFSDCHDTPQKQKLKKELSQIKRIASNVPIVKNQDQEILKHWHTWAIREMVLLKDFVPDPRRIVTRLRNLVSELDAHRSLSLLQRLKYFTTLPNGRNVLHEPVLSTTHELSSHMIKNLHGQFLRLAFDAIFALSVKERSVQGVTIALPASKVDEVRQKIRTLCKEISEMFDENYQNDNVYHVVIAFFPLTTSAP